MKYSIIKESKQNLKRYVSFRVIEKVIVHNDGMMFQEYTRFYGSELFVIYDDGKVTLTENEDDATVFFDNNKAQVALLSIINKIKNKEIMGAGVQVIEYNEIHSRSSEVLHYPNRYYSDLIQPISIYNGHSKELEIARERRAEDVYCKAYRELVDYIECRGWELSEDDWDYINNVATTNNLQHLLRINRGRNNFIITGKRR